MRRAGVIAIVALCAWPVAARAAEDGGPAASTAPGEAAATATGNPAATAPDWADAKETLNEARLAASNPAEAGKRITRLKRAIRKYPAYPDRAWLHYYLGMNYQLLGRQDKAADAFDEALRRKPELAERTPINAYLAQARQEQFQSWSSAGLIGLLIVVLIASVWGLARRGQAVRWRRLLILFLLAAAIWAAAILLLPRLLAKPDVGLGDYPKPALPQFRLGDLGDRTLWILLGYGLGAIAASMVVMAGVSGLRRPAKLILGLAGTLAVTFALMGLFTARYCYHQCRYDAGSGRLIFMVKDIATMKEVPEKMLPLYDENFRNRIIESKKKK